MDKELDKLINDVNKKLGAGTIDYCSQAKGLSIQRLPTGSLALDIETGGGWAQGKINEVFGRYSSGKSFLMYSSIAAFQKKYPESYAGLIDSEGSFDNLWARKIDVDLDRLIISRPEWMEEGLDTACALIDSQKIGLLVIDSWGAFCPKSELEGTMQDSTVALRARIGNKFIRKFRPKASETEEDIDLGKTTLLVVNQVYSTIGTYATEETPGGEAIKHGAMVRVKVRKGGKDSFYLDKEGGLLAQESIFVVEKNKTFPPRKTGSFWFSVEDNDFYGKAGTIYRVGELLTYAELCGIIRQSGKWFSVPGVEKSFNGEKAVLEYLNNLPEDEMENFEKIVMEKYQATRECYE